jgi:predicted ATPase
MHRIASVSIEGFWETHNIAFKLDPFVNFFIGQNGTGKTTLINLLAATLTVDFHALDRISFKKVSIFLKHEEKNDAPSITVTKEKRREKAFDVISYRIKSGKTGASETKFSLDEIEEQYLLRQISPGARYRNEVYRSMSSGVAAAIRELVSVNWLSIHRISMTDRSREERSFESTVDMKLEALSNDLVRFFATLSRLKDDEVRPFQESLILSLLEREDDVKKMDFPGVENIAKYKEALETIFKELHVGETRVAALIASFDKRGKTLKDKLQSNKNRQAKNLDFHDLIFLTELRRIDEIVTRWNKLQDRLKEIFALRDNFIKITNDLLKRKVMEITDSNELQFKTRSGKVLTPQMLSSGEKQLLILLSETLLQRERASIYIADEPELSLHVLWQEKLVSSLRALNPSTQIIVATHSPDIVGQLESHAIDMETLIP